jgi:hypothetical protein
MSAVPPLTPVIMPVNLPAAAVSESELVQTPPGVVLVKEIVLPTHTDEGPVIAPGIA